MLRRKKRTPPVWAQEEEQAYNEYLEACKTFPKEPFLSRSELNRIHEQIFGLSKPRNFLRRRKFWVIAAMIAAILGAMTTAAAFQTQIRRFLLHESSIATDVEVLPPDDEENSETISYYWDAGYIPEGYTLFFTDISPLDTILIYANEGTNLEISTMALNEIPSVDTENTQKEKIEIAGGSGYLYTTPDDSKTRVILLYKDCMVFVAGEISQEEMLKIVDSLYTTTIT